MTEDRKPGVNKDGEFDGLDDDMRGLVIPQVNNCIQGAKFYASKEPPDEKRLDRNIDAAKKTLGKHRQKVEDEIGDRPRGMDA